MPEQFPIPEKAMKSFLWSMECPHCGGNLIRDNQGIHCPHCSWAHQPKTAMAERTGDPEIDQILEEFMEHEVPGQWKEYWQEIEGEFPGQQEGWWPKVEYLRDPDLSAGSCVFVASNFADFAQERGFKAWMVPGATGPDDFNYTDREVPGSTAHAWAYIAGKDGAVYGVDFTATQYGYLEHPMVQKLKNPDVWERNDPEGQTYPKGEEQWERQWPVVSSIDTRYSSQSVLHHNRGEDLIGLPTKPVKVGPHGELEFGSNKHIQNVAESYMQKSGLPYRKPRHYIPVEPGRASAIANEWEAMEHRPNDPDVRKTYDAFKQETRDQYEHALAHGYNFEFYPEGQDPYPHSPREAVLDLHKNRHMFVYPTIEGYGTDIGQGNDIANMPDHPMLEDTGYRWGDKPVTYNDLFRATHDFYGHAKEGVGFRADGEENAWRQHASMYSDAARPAMTNETRAQNSWVNYGPHGEHNQTANHENTIYPPQKAGLLPSWVHTEGMDDPDQRWAAADDFHILKGPGDEVLRGKPLDPDDPDPNLFEWVPEPQEYDVNTAMQEAANEGYRWGLHKHPTEPDQWILQHKNEPGAQHTVSTRDLQLKGYGIYWSDPTLPGGNMQPKYHLVDVQGREMAGQDPFRMIWHTERMDNVPGWQEPEPGVRNEEHFRKRDPNSDFYKRHWGSAEDDQLADFFNRATQGEYAPAQQLRPEHGPQHIEHQQFYQDYNDHSGEFTKHIDTSIPQYAANQANKGQALINAFPGAKVLDIAGEGSWGKALASQGMEAHTLEPNQAMHQAFDKTQVPGAKMIPMAFGEKGFQNEKGDWVAPHAATPEYDVVHAAMAYQFIGPERDQQIEQSKRYLKPGGLLIVDEKVTPGQSRQEQQQWDYHEGMKDQWKSQYYTPEQQALKNQQVGFQPQSARKTWYHLTDNPAFELDPTKRPMNNTTWGGDWPDPGLFVSPDPNMWYRGKEYPRPFVVELEGEPRDEMQGYGQEQFIHAEDFPNTQIKRVIPYSGYEAEAFENTPYTGKDVRDMTPEEIKEHFQHSNEYIRNVVPHLLPYRCSNCGEDAQYNRCEYCDKKEDPEFDDYMLRAYMPQYKENRPDFYKLGGMMDMMVSKADLERALQKQFRFVSQYWSSGNFKGYIASDSQDTINRFLQHYKFTDHGHEAEPVPKLIGDPARGYVESSVTQYTDSVYNVTLRRTSNVADLIATTLTNGGGTFQQDLAPATFPFGYLVSMKGYGAQIPVQEFGPKEVTEWLEDVPLQAQDFIGTWVDKAGQVFLDVTQHFEELADAIQFAMDNDQQAIYDAGTDTVLETKDFMRNERT